MDSWTPIQLNLMKTGGNAKCAAYLKQKGVDANAPIKQKYESPAAQLYKEILKARVEGRPEPTELPKAKPRSGGFVGGGVTAKPGEDPYGMERLTGETDQQYIGRQTRLREEAKQRMASKFSGGSMGGAGSSGMGSGRMAGIGSDPNYNPNAGYGGPDLNVDGLVAGFGSALSTFGSVAKGAAVSAQSMIKDEQLQNMGSSLSSTGGSIWNTFASSVSSVAASLTQPDGGDGLEEFNRQMSSQRSATGSKYGGFGSDSMGGGSGGMANGGSMGGHSPTTSLQEAPGAPGEDRNGIEQLTGETDEQYIMRHTRLRDEAKARMAAKFGGGGLSSASSSSKASAQQPSWAPSAGATQARPAASPAGGRSAPTSGAWGGVVTTQKKAPAVKMKVEKPEDFFANFGA